MKQIQKALEEEKAAASKAKGALDKQKDEYEREKASQGEHFWRVTEELKAAKTELATAVQQHTASSQQLEEYQRTHSINEDRILMTGEDVAAAGMRLNDKANFFFIEKHTLKSEIDSLRSFLLVKEVTLLTHSLTYSITHSLTHSGRLRRSVVEVEGLRGRESQ